MPSGRRSKVLTPSPSFAHACQPVKVPGARSRGARRAASRRPPSRARRSAPRPVNEAPVRREVGAGGAKCGGTRPLHFQCRARDTQKATGQKKQTYGCLSVCTQILPSQGARQSTAGTPNALARETPPGDLHAVLELVGVGGLDRQHLHHLHLGWREGKQGK